MRIDTEAPFEVALECDMIPAIEKGSHTSDAGAKSVDRILDHLMNGGDMPETSKQKILLSLDQWIQTQELNASMGRDLRNILKGKPLDSDEDHPEETLEQSKQT